MRRCSKDWMFKLASRWEYGRFHRPGSLLVKNFSTDSILLIRYLWWVTKQLQYSSIGRTYGIYAFNRSLQLRDTKHLRTSLALTMALCTIEDVWASDFKRWSTITPRSPNRTNTTELKRNKCNTLNKTMVHPRRLRPPASCTMDSSSLGAVV